MRIHDLNFPFGFLHKIVCIGYFFNNFLPTTIGGDSYRVIKTMPGGNFKLRALSAVLIERIIGLSVLLFLGFIASLVIHYRGNLELINIYSYTGLSIIFGGVCIYFAFRIEWIRKKSKQISSFHKWTAITDNFTTICRNKYYFINLMSISIIFHIVAFTSTYLLFKAFGLQVLFLHCAVIVALVGIANIIPLSINGIGIVEGSFVYVSMQLGVALDHAVIIAFILRVMTIPYSLICGGIYIIDSLKTDKQQSHSIKIESPKY